MRWWHIRHHLRLEQTKAIRRCHYLNSIWIVQWATQISSIRLGAVLTQTRLNLFQACRGSIIRLDRNKMLHLYWTKWLFNTKSRVILKNKRKDNQERIRIMHLIKHRKIRKDANLQTLPKHILEVPTVVEQTAVIWNTNHAQQQQQH